MGFMNKEIQSQVKEYLQNALQGILEVPIATE